MGKCELLLTEGSEISSSSDTWPAGFQVVASMPDIGNKSDQPRLSDIRSVRSGRIVRIESRFVGSFQHYLLLVSENQSSSQPQPSLGDSRVMSLICNMLAAWSIVQHFHTNSGIYLSQALKLSSRAVISFAVRCSES